MAKDIGKGTLKCADKDTAIERAKGTARRTVKCTAENQGKVQKKYQIKIQLEVGYFAYLCIEKTHYQIALFFYFQKSHFRAERARYLLGILPTGGAKVKLSFYLKNCNFYPLLLKDPEVAKHKKMRVPVLMQVSQVQLRLLV